MVKLEGKEITITRQWLTLGNSDWEKASRGTYRSAGMLFLVFNLGGGSKQAFALQKKNPTFYLFMYTLYLTINTLKKKKESNS